MSTKPKSVLEAEANQQDGSGSSSAASATRNVTGKRRSIREFLNKYKQLPDDFLRIPVSYYQVQPQQMDIGFMPNHSSGSGQLVDMIDISVVEAQLVKNYGLLKMDCYCKIRVGHMVCETNTSTNCAKNPKWDGVYQFALKPGIDSFHLEIYNEKQFSLDEKIAWLHEPIPSEIFHGITVERWFPLSGRLGKDKEGSILLVLSHKTKLLSRSILPHNHLQHQEMFLPPGASQMIPGVSMLPVDPNIQIPTYVQPPPTPTRPGQQAPAPQTQMIERQQVQQRQQPSGGTGARPASEEDIGQLAEMFPSIDRNIIKTILENNDHDKDASISTLLAMG